MSDYVRFIVDGREMPPPTVVSWESPDVLATAITAEPVLGSGWKCTISYGLTIEPELIDAFIGLLGKRLPMVISPCPFALCADFTLFGSIASVSPRYTQTAIGGLDIRVTNITMGFGG